MEPERIQEGNEEDEPITRTINVIAGGFVEGGTTKSTCKKYLQEILSLLTEEMKKTRKLLPIPDIIFSSSDIEGVVPRHNDPMIILVVMVNIEGKRVFVAQGSSIVIIF